MKPLKIARQSVESDLQGIYDYHAACSLQKAERILDEYDHVIGLIEINPLIFHQKAGGRRAYPFDSGTYFKYYIELEECWLVPGIFHARRDPEWIDKQLTGRTPPQPGT
jgi:plasmid stabilization system protein ParE